MTARIRDLLVLVVLAGAAQAGVIVVDPNGGSGGGALLQAALDGAVDGDILLLRAGGCSDQGLTLSGKRPALVNDAQGLEIALRRLNVTLPTGDGTLLLRGLTLSPPALDTTAGAGLFVSVSFATTTLAVWIEDCVATGGLADVDGPAGLPTFAHPGIVLAFVPRVTIIRTTARGADGFDEVPQVDPATAGAAGLHATLGTIIVHESSFTGGHGGDGTGGFFGTNGGPGLAIEPAVVTIMGGALQGGDEGESNPATTTPGPGLQVGSSATAWIRGKQGGFAIASVLPTPQFLGVITDPSGALDVPFALPPLPPGTDGELVFLPSGVMTAGGELLIGGATALVWIDDAF